MDSVLIVTSTEKGRGFFSELLRSHAFETVSMAASGGEARRNLLEYEYDLVIINAPLQDEFGHELALYTAQSTSAGIILVVKAELEDTVSQKVEDNGILVIPKPVSRTAFFQAIKLLNATRKRLLGLKDQNIKLQQKIEEIRLVDRAKCALIQYLGMTEDKAHHYIEKQAMDLRCPKYEIAKNILKTYEP